MLEFTIHFGRLRVLLGLYLQNEANINLHTDYSNTIPRNHVKIIGAKI